MRIPNPFLLTLLVLRISSSRAQCPLEDPRGDSCEIINELMIQQAMPGITQQLQTTLEAETWFSDTDESDDFSGIALGEFTNGRCNGQAAWVDLTVRRVTGLDQTVLLSMNPTELGDDFRCNGLLFWRDCGFDMAYDPIEISARAYTLWAEAKLASPSGDCASTGSAQIHVMNPKFNTAATYMGEIGRTELTLDGAVYREEFPTVTAGALEVDIDAYEVIDLITASQAEALTVALEAEQLRALVERILTQQIVPLVGQALAPPIGEQGDGGSSSLLKVDLEGGVSRRARYRLYWNQLGVSWNGVGEAAGPFADSLGNATGTALDTVGNATGNVLGTAGNATTNVLDTIGNAATSVFGTMVDAGVSVMETLMSPFRAVWCSVTGCGWTADDEAEEEEEEEQGSDGSDVIIPYSGIWT